MESTQSNERLLNLFHKIPPEELKELYERHGGKNVTELVQLIRRDGANSLATWLYRWGEGVDYDEIVRDVAAQIKVEYKEKDINSEEDLEQIILQHLIKKHFESLPEEEREKIEKHMESLGEQYKNFWRYILEMKGNAILLLINTIGRQAVTKIITQILSRFVASRAGAIAATRIVGLAIPFINIFLGVWTAIDLLGPANRKIVPTVFQIALLRLEHGGDE